MTYRKFHQTAGGLLRPLLLSGAVVALAISSGCGKGVPMVEAAHPVIAMTVTATDGAQQLQFPGEVHARYETPLSFRVAGQLVTRYARLGDTVKKGQLLAQLDDSDATRTQVSAQAALGAAAHRLIFATQQRDRDEAQAKQNLISQLQLEQTRDTYASALAAQDQAKQQLALAQNQKGYDTLVADRNGVITSEQAEAGQVVAAGQPVFGFAWSGDRDVFIDVPEDRLASISVAQAATVTLSSLPGERFVGHVREISPSADSQTRAYRVKVTLDTPGPQLHLGMTTEVSLSAKSSGSEAVSVAATALFHQGEKPAVWVVRPADSTLELRPVTILRYSERDVLISQGLRPGEHVVMQGVHTVSVGEKVEPVAPPHAEDAPL